jgi:hypothetical protein
MRVNLKRSLGEGGAFLGDSHGEDNLYKLLKSIAKAARISVDVLQATPSAAVIATKLITESTRLAAFGIALGTTGTTSGTTTVVVNKNGSPIAGVTLSIAYDEDDGTSKFLDASDFGDIDLDQGDILTIEVTAATSTSPANLLATAELSPIKVEV